MKKKYYATGCPYCDHWGPESGCWPCIRSRPWRLAKKVAMKLGYRLKRMWP